MPNKKLSPTFKRKWFQLNIPMMLDIIVLAYFFFTFIVLGDSAIHSRNPHASVHLLKKSKPVPVGNAFGDFGLMIFPTSEFFAFIHQIPDMAMSLVLGSLTLMALHIAALSDPGEVPSYWGPKIRSSNNESEEDSENDKNNGSNNNNNNDSSSLLSGYNYSVKGERFDPNIHVHPENVTGWTICDKCDIWRPPRAFHCRECGACQCRNDHHCMWIANHVAAANHKCFWLFLLYICSSISHFWVMLFRFFMAESFSSWVRRSDSIGIILFLFIYTIVVLSTSFFALIFFCSTTWSMCIDETTLEEMIRRKPRPGSKAKIHPEKSDPNYESLWGDEPSEAAKMANSKVPRCVRMMYIFMKRIYRNLTVVLGPNPLLWLVPSLVALENPLPKLNQIRKPGDFV